MAKWQGLPLTSRTSLQRMTRGQKSTLLAATLGSGIATIDGTVVNVALPAIEHDLGGGLQAQQWVSNEAGGSREFPQ
jgi:hypothetical protein